MYKTLTYEWLGTHGALLIKLYMTSHYISFDDLSAESYAGLGVFRNLKAAFTPPLVHSTPALSVVVLQRQVLEQYLIMIDGGV